MPVRVSIVSNADRPSDHDELQKVVDIWYGRVLAACHARLASRQDAEDAAQETFARYLTRVADGQPVGCTAAWLRSVAHNVCVDLLRRRRVRHAECLSEDRCVSLDEGSGLIEQQDDAQRLHEIIAELDVPLREVILLHYYNTLSYDEIAAWLQIARSTVNERLKRARETLKNRLNAGRCCDEV